MGMTRGSAHGRAARGIARGLGAAALLCALSAAPAGAAGITNSGNDLRDGWYPGQPRLGPDAVSSATFGNLWQAPVDGQVYAQPLVVGTSVIVATERNHIYSLDTETGTENWSVDLGPSYPASLIGCSDLTPDLGVTATPVIDPATNTIYLTHKTYDSGTSGPAAWYMDALDAATGQQRAHFPKQLTGSADNAPGVTFQATTELQRPGLLLMDGTVYAGFGGHCDLPPYQGWVFGVDAADASIKARWSALTTADASGNLNGAGIWQSGAGLMSDGPGRIFVSTGNGGSPQPPLATPGGNFGESIVRLAVQPGGTLRAMDFFAPFDAADLDTYDADFASGGVTALRDDAFGTSAYPHVAVAVGKAGYVYLLDRDNLGGIQMGANHGDDVLARDGPYGGVWSRPGVWPGDGGWIAIPTASPAADDDPAASGSSGHLDLFRYRVGNDGTPSLDAPVESDDAFGFGSSAPIITSDGTTSGSAVLWTVWSPDGSGYGAQLRAYDAVPVNGHVHLRRSWPVGQAAKFTMPGVGAGRIFVGTRDGNVLAYGAPIAAEVQAPATTFPLTTTGQTSTVNIRLAISGTVDITSITAGDGSASPPFTAHPGSDIPGTFTDGDTVTVPVDFSPTDPGVAGGTLIVNTDKGTFSFSLTGTGQSAQPLLTASPAVVSFGGGLVGDTRAGTITIGNGGAQALTVTAVDLPGTPFSVTNAPHAGQVIAAGASINVTVRYTPTAVGDFSDELTVTTTGGTKVVGMTGSAGTGPVLALTPSAGWDFGVVDIGTSTTLAVTVANAGDTPMRITKSKPPIDPAFAVLDRLDEGTLVAARQSRTLRVAFTPAAVGTVSDTWTLNAADGSGVHEIALTGTGVDPDTAAGGAGEGGGAGPAATAPASVFTAPALAPAAIGPDLAPATPTVVKVRPDLYVSKVKPSRNGRSVAISGRVVRAATGTLGVTLAARVGRQTLTAKSSVRLRRRSTYAITIRLTPAMRGWRRLQATARFQGSAHVWPGASTMTLVRAR
jgi:hypothetical protein